MPTNTSTARASSPEKTFGLPRSSRVLGNREFRRIYARGARAGGKDLTVVAYKRREQGHRLGLSVSKANGCAVVRNKIKRIFREAFRLERPNLVGSYDLILIPKERPGKYQLVEVRAELKQLVERIEAGKGRRRKPRKS